MAYKILEGEKYGRLTFIRLVPKHPKSKCIRGLFLCECGKETEVNTCLVIKGRTKSCGCLVGESAAKRAFKHGFSRRGKRAPEYGAYRTMIARCYDPNSIGFPDYGSRGIKVSDSWLSSFQNFIDDMGLRPEKTSSLDRIDSNGDYCKENCRWSNPTDQANNRRSSKFLTVDGRTQTVSRWCKELGVRPALVYCRLKCGWPAERALKEPVYKKGVSKRYQEHLTGNHTAV